MANLINITLEATVSLISQEKEIKDIQIRKKENKLSLFSDRTVVYIEYCNKPTEKVK
jgi:hypothetical protein